MDPESTKQPLIDVSQVMAVDIYPEHQSLSICSLSNYENSLIETTVSLQVDSPDLQLVIRLAEENLIAATTPLFDATGKKILTIKHFLDSQEKSGFLRKKSRRRVLIP
ncbi:MAG: hypothetical protein ACRCWD_00670 [Culicoidibacterales bacterium]